MPKPFGFSWINEPLLAAMAEPIEPEEFTWLRKQGIQLVISLTETPPRRNWINDAGLMHMHEPVVDMTPPTLDQIKRILSAIKRANEHNLGVAVHCAAGLGRTGVVLACYFVSQGRTAKDAINYIRELRPGSIETFEQEETVREFGKKEPS